ncbi:UNVERIFIED_CONTAM: hypothetical protein FKN15_023594 [Acipenser sinensis]
MLLQVSGFQGQALGQSLAGLVVARRQLWLSQAKVPDTDKSTYLPWPYSWASSRRDPATLPLRAGGVSTGSSNAPFPYSGAGEDESLASVRDTDGDPDGSDPHCAAW